MKSKVKKNGRIKSVADLVPDSKNIRRHSSFNLKTLEDSLHTVGAARSIVIDEDGRILAGNGLVEAAVNAGIERVKVIDGDGEEIIAVRRSGLSKQQKVRLAFYDNYSSDTSAYDYDAALLAQLASEDELVKRLAQEDKRLRELLQATNGTGEAETTDASELIDRAEQLQKKYGVKFGDVWELESRTVKGKPHRIVCGDSTHEADIESLMRDERAAMVFTDPPYGVAIGNKNKFLNSFQPSGRNLENIAGDFMGKDELFDMLARAFTLARERAMSDCCAVYVTAPQGGELCLMMMMMMTSGLPVRHVLNWVKNAPTFSLGRLDYDYQHEPILFTWTKRHKHYGLGAHRTSVWAIDKPRASKEHPTMKPVELVENALLNSSMDGDICLDLFLGSGTTIVACEITGRVGRGLEIEPRYVSVCLERWATLTGLTPQRVAHG